MLEWEGKLASILFLPECNLRCPFCHAKSLVLDADSLDNVPFKKVADYLNKKRGWIDAVCITGGEPTLHEWLFDLIDEIKKLKFLVMVETNGTRPEKIKALLETERLDYISMDIKAALDSGYEKAVAVCVDIDKIKQSIGIIMRAKIDYEFRTTVVPGIINPEDIEKIAEYIKGAKRLVLQQFLPKDTIDPAYLKIKPYPRKVLEEMAETARKFVDTIVIRNE